jgi:DNA polymerase-3 subunit epsilon
MQTAEVSLDDGPSLVASASAEEIECVLRWLELPGTRLVAASQGWASPAFGAGRLRSFCDASSDARLAATPFADRRRLPMSSRPARAGV